MKIVNIEGNLRNLNEFFRKDVTYDDIKSHKNKCFILYLEDSFLENTTEGSRVQWGQGRVAVGVEEVKLTSPKSF